MGEFAGDDNKHVGCVISVLGDSSDTPMNKTPSGVPLMPRIDLHQPQKPGLHQALSATRLIGRKTHGRRGIDLIVSLIHKT